MDLLKSTRFYILVNGKQSDYFQPSCGLRQGCPLSPYLFLLCSQGLSSLSNRQSELGNLCGVKCGRNAPFITHLFFADDTLILGEADLDNCNTIRGVIQIYEASSGQVINLNKNLVSLSDHIQVKRRKIWCFQSLICSIMNLGSLSRSPIFYGVE